MYFTPGVDPHQYLFEVGGVYQVENPFHVVEHGKQVELPAGEKFVVKSVNMDTRHTIMVVWGRQFLSPSNTYMRRFCQKIA